MKPFIHLHAHSQYSILQSTLSVESLVLCAKDAGASHVTITDNSNLYGAVDFYKAATKHGVSPIIGCEFKVAPRSHLEKKKLGGERSGYTVVLLAKDIRGYHSLCKLSSRSFTHGFYYTPRIDKELIATHSEGLIALIGCDGSYASDLIIDDNASMALSELEWYQATFGNDLYFQIENHTMTKESLHNGRILNEGWLEQKYKALLANESKVRESLSQFSSQLSVPLVATNNVRYKSSDDAFAHEILMNVQSGESVETYSTDMYGNIGQKEINPKRDVLFSEGYTFKQHKEMELLFTANSEALAVTNDIAALCNVELDFSARHYPVFSPPDSIGKSEKERALMAEEFLKSLCESGLQSKYTEEALSHVQKVYPDQDPMSVVQKRLDYELSIIIPKGMCDYLLIVYDFIAWAKKQDIPVGPGRGSGAGSIILFLIGVTDIEPLRFSLFFERFINPERISYPDIDVDICMERRGEVIEYTLEKYGKENVAQIITFGTMKAKMAIKDVGRVLSVPLSKVNAIAKLVPDDLSITIEKALEDADFQAMYKSDSDAKRVIDYAKKLEGSVRNTGIHAAGVIISGEPLTEHIPVCVSKDSDMYVTQYAMKPVESVGMLKIDFLGLKTLTSIQKTVDAIKEYEGIDLDWMKLPLGDKPTFDLLNQGKTSGVFQLESTGMQELASKLHIDKFEEIIAVGALYRPGPMEMIPSFIRRKHGEEDIEIDHPRMASILSETYGIMVYQEQVMQIASELAGFSLGEGDVLRKAMGKKDQEEMKRQGVKFQSGAVALGVDKDIADTIFNKIEKFASYGFNKAHATAYGYLSYVTAFLKANYPLQWMAALMTCDMFDLSKVAKHIRECEAMDISILSPDVNESSHVFTATSNGIRFALSAIKGVGDGVVHTIIEERKKNGGFTSIESFVKRLDIKKIGKKTILYLIDAGAFDFEKKPRPYLAAVLESIFDGAVKAKKDEEKGFLDLFVDEDETSLLGSEEVIYQEETPLERLTKEKERVGFYLTGHPLKECEEKVSLFGANMPTSFKGVEAYKMVCIIDTVQVKIAGKTGKKFAIITCSDSQNRHELAVWSDMYATHAHLLQENMLIACVVIVDASDGVKLQFQWLKDLTTVSDSVRQEADIALQSAQSKAKHMIQRAKNQVKKIVEEEKKPQRRVEIFLDADRCRLSDIMKISACIESAPGTDIAILVFRSGHHSEKRVEADATFKGIAYSQDIEKLLSQIPAVTHIEIGGS